MGRRRDLSKEELALWRRVAQTARPLRAPSPRAAEDKAGSAGPPPDRSPPARSRPERPAVSGHSGRIEQTLVRRIAKGRQPIDARIDLHGLRAADALPRLRRFLEDAQSRGARVVLVITGKGSRPGVAGVLRREVPLWLSQPQLRRLVVGFEQADRRHGGEGALYVHVRRVR